ncbi:hypothetical protein [Paraburkholderia caffeinilytica]|uniref:hypothetical protein n=1 Tax=Paraburkholderia caffeinilytica TaxID=1761016 RepID=UPI003DA131AF
MPAAPLKRNMTDAQRKQLLRAVETGLQWTAGEISFDEVQQTLGKSPDGPIERGIERVYRYEPDFATLEFVFDTIRSNDGKAAVKYFMLRVSSDITTHIAKESYESLLGLHRLVRGELIDGVRAEPRDFFNPGLGGFLGDRNHVGLSYRLPLPVDSIFDVYADLDFEGRDDPPDYVSLKDAENLRSVIFTRSYLTPTELDRRRQMKRQKYDEMNLCTGMLCPETGLWQGWSENGATDRLFVRAGQRFDQVRLHAYQPTVREQWVSGRWMWMDGRDAGA